MANPLAGVSMVLVTEISPAKGRGVAHFLQNCESEVFSVSHFGHLIDMLYPYIPVLSQRKTIKELGKCQTEMPGPQDSKLLLQTGLFTDFICSNSVKSFVSFDRDSLYLICINRVFFALSKEKKSVFFKVLD